MQSEKSWPVRSIHSEVANSCTGVSSRFNRPHRVAFLLCGVAAGLPNSTFRSALRCWVGGTVGGRSAIPYQRTRNFRRTAHRRTAFHLRTHRYKRDGAGLGALPHCVVFRSQGLYSSGLKGSLGAQSEVCDCACWSRGGRMLLGPSVVRFLGTNEWTLRSNPDCSPFGELVHRSRGTP